MRRYILLICVLLSACAGLPAAVKNIPVADLTYSQARQNPNSYKDIPVRWGGVIIEVENEENFTLVQVLSHPLNYYGRSQLSRPSEGRFVIKSSEFLDPAVYAKDKEITVAANNMIDRGLSLDLDIDYVKNNFKSANRIKSVPEGLAIAQRGGRMTHLEVISTRPMEKEEYKALLLLIKFFE